MADDLMEAARHMTDPIQHDNGWLGKVIGGLVALAIAVAIVVIICNPVGLVAAAATASAAAFAVAGVVSTACTVGLGAAYLGEKIGEFIGEMCEWTGDIEKGSPNVSIGHRAKQAARATDPVKCHTGKKIAEGMRYISINDLPASRKDHKTECAGKIKDGCKTVLYAGPTIQVLHVTTFDEEWRGYNIFKDVVDWVGFITGLPGFFAKGGIKMLWEWKGKSPYKIFSGIYDVIDTAIFAPKKVVEGKAELYLGDNTPSWLQKYDFTDGAAYRTFDFVWGAVGLGKAGKDAYDARVAPKPGAAAPTPDAPAPAAPAPKPATPDAPAAPAPAPKPASPDAPTTRADLPNREPVPPVPQRQPGPEFEFEGRRFRNSPGHSNLDVPSYMAKPGPPLPDRAPRIELTIPPRKLIVLPDEAPRIHMPPPKQIVDRFGNPYPKPAPRLQDPVPDVPPSVAATPPTPPPNPKAPDPPAPAAPAPKPADPPKFRDRFTIDKPTAWLGDRTQKPGKLVGKAMKQGEKTEKMLKSFKPHSEEHVEDIPPPYSP